MGQRHKQEAWGMLLIIQQKTSDVIFFSFAALVAVCVAIPTPQWSKQELCGFYNPLFGSFSNGDVSLQNEETEMSN